MSDPFRHGILGGPPKPPARCPVTNRVFEVGSGALPFEEQTRWFVLEHNIESDLPREGEVSPHGYRYEVSVRAAGLADRLMQTKTQQDRRFAEAKAAEQPAPQNQPDIIERVIDAAGVANATPDAELVAALEAMPVSGRA